MKITSLYEIDSDQYNTYIDHHPDANFYHLLAWHQVLSSTYGCKPKYVIAEEKGKIVGVAVFMEVNSFLKGMRLVSLPFSHYVPILVDHSDVLEKILKFLDGCTANYKYIELRTSHPGNQIVPAQVIAENIFSCINLAEFENAETYWDALKEPARRNIRKAKNYFHISASKEINDFEIIYDLTARTKKKHGTPAYPRQFFLNLHKMLLPYIELYTAYYNDIPISSVLILNYKFQAIYAYGGSLHNHSAMQYRPSDYCMWEAIKTAIDNKNTSFDLGTTPKYHKGLAQYKDKWAPKNRDLTYLILPKHYKNISRQGLLVKGVSYAVKKIPFTLNKWVDPLLLKEAI
jgi:Acetyltransferase (GNAT) domain